MQLEKLKKEKEKQKRQRALTAIEQNPQEKYKKIVPQAIVSFKDLTDN